MIASSRSNPVPLPKGAVQPCPVSGLAPFLCNESRIRERITLNANPAGVFVFQREVDFQPNHLASFTSWLRGPERQLLLTYEVCYKDAPYSRATKGRGRDMGGHAMPMGSHSPAAELMGAMFTP